MKTPRLLLLVVVVASSAACVRVKPYQREHLARRSLSFGSERTENHFRQHLFEAREGGRGGYGEAGGGCGCN